MFISKEDMHVKMHNMDDIVNNMDDNLKNTKVINACFGKGVKKSWKRRKIWIFCRISIILNDKMYVLDNKGVTIAGGSYNHID